MFVDVSRRSFLRGAFSAAGALGVGAVGGAWAAAGKRPNILVFMADDLGYSDIGCFGSKEIRTPVLDGLAGEGIRFTDFYAAAPNCSPARTGMLTGRFPSRVGMYSYVPTTGPLHLRRSEITSAGLLRKSGYDTAHLGKWHLCNDLRSDKLPNPGDHGFSHWMATENNAIPSHRNPNNFVRNGEALGEVEGYSCQIVADEALRWLGELRDPKKPFFLNIWFHEPHAKVAAPEEFLAKHPGQEDAAYLGCIENMDAAIGRVLKAVDRLGLAGETFVIFTSDNGSYRASGSNEPFRGKKSFVFEGGIREPTIMRWPGRIEPGTQSDVAASGVDMMPTFCQMAGIEPPKDRTIDGASIVPVFRGGSVARKTPLYWFFYRTDPACAMREGEWSMLGYLDEKVPAGHAFSESHMKYVKRARPNRFELYNLKRDPAQTKDVAGENGEVFASMKRRMIALHEDMIQEGPEWY